MRPADIPVDHVYGSSVLLDYLASKRIPAGELVVVSPDVGGVARARAFAKKLNDAPLAIVDKRRSSHNVSEVMNLIGDVQGKVRAAAGPGPRGRRMLRPAHGCRLHAPGTGAAGPVSHGARHGPHRWQCSWTT